MKIEMSNLKDLDQTKLQIRVCNFKNQNVCENQNLGLRFQKHKIRVNDFKTRNLLVLTISKRDLFAKSKTLARVNEFKTRFFAKSENLNLGFTISKCAKMEIGVNDQKEQNVLGLTISKRVLCLPNR